MLQHGGCRLWLNSTLQSYPISGLIDQKHQSRITMKEKNMDRGDEILRQLMQSAGKKAPENLQHRILHQIETEHALTPKKETGTKNSVSLMRDLGGIFGTMYILLAAIVTGGYLLLGKAFLQSPGFWGTVVLVSLIFNLFWLITRLDDYLREKKR